MTDRPSPSEAAGSSLQPQLNSEEYWSARFADDWEAKSGPEQTQFFYRLALKLLPSWLVRALHEESLSICDWGCATGEGTDLLAQVFPGPVTGIDFAKPAIEKARAHYTKPEFLSVDLLSEKIDAKYDILFCSNTLEHFSNPWEVVDLVSAYAQQALVILIPFREYERHSEHEVTFDPPMVPALLSDRFHLVNAHVVDAAASRPSYWPGEQILLVYVTKAMIERHALALEDLTVELEPARSSEATAAMQAELLSLQARLADAEVSQNAMQRALQQKDDMLADAEASRDATQRALQLKDDMLAVREAQVADIYRSRSWRATAPLRAATMGVRSGTRGAKEVSWRSMRALYRSLPLSQGTKQKLRGALAGRLNLLGSFTATQTHPLSIEPTDAPATRDKPDVFMWAIIDWHFRIQRPQHLARAFANRGHRTFYFSGHFIDAAKPGFRIEPLSEDGSLQIVYLQVPGAPAIYFGMPPANVEAAIAASLGLFLQWAEPREILSLVQHPFWKPFADRVPNRKVIYDLMDHHEGFEDNAPDVIAAEHALLREADHVIVTSTFLEELAKKSNSHVSMVRNAGEYKHFAERPADVYQDEQGRRIIGYYGAIAEWFDLDLVERLARERPDDCILLIGADTAKAKERLARLPNVVMTGEVPYSELPFYLYAFDVCILPFKVIPLTLATNPVKVYEYLSAGKPVVSVDLPEISQFGDLVARASIHDTFVAQVAEALDDAGGAGKEAGRRRFASEQTWDHRVASFAQALEETRSPRGSVIVVTYNNLAFTKTCLFSLERDTAYDDFEIIVVDNASSDGTPDYLREWESGGDNRIVILNEDNRGFAAANNQGLARSTGDYLVLLNNDTFVTPGWLGTLVSHLKRDSLLGLVGPVTNNIGNEARIDIRYSNMVEMRQKALSYTAQRLGQLHPTANVAFFCVAFTRRTYEAIGDLDERFGVGFFEDDDYCRRAEALGLHVAIADDVFIHHHLSASFDALAAERKKELFEKNKLIYEAKWGPWTPHQYRRKS